MAIPRTKARKASGGQKRRTRSPADGDSDDFYNFLRTEARRWLQDPNIIGISLADKLTSGSPTGITSVRFDVVGKLPALAEIIRAGSRPIPVTLQIGELVLPTDVIEAWPEANAAPPILRKSRLDPVLGGISIGSATDTGTLGAVLWHRPSRQAVVLSNWHVLANNPDESFVYQPGPADGTGPPSRLGRVKDRALDIDLDAAVATIEGRQTRDILGGLGTAVTGVVEPKPGMKVVKSGKETQVTFGRISTASPYKLTKYHIFGRPVWHEIIVCVIEVDPQRPPSGALSVKGDSGSCWVLVGDDGAPTGQIVGLHVAGDAGLRLAYACRADKLFERFSLEPLSARHDQGLQPLLAAVTAISSKERVIARDGLIIRAGPGREFGKRGELSFDTVVSVVSRSDDWKMIDVRGDGRADGFVHASFLVPV